MEKITLTKTATALHLSSLLQYFIPLGNFVFPIIIWSFWKEKSEFVDEQGKEVINFQLSLFIYSLVIMLLATPIILFMIFNQCNFNYSGDINLMFNGFNFTKISGGIIILSAAFLFFLMVKIAEFILIIVAAVTVAKGTHFKYPFTINFLK